MDVLACYRPGVDDPESEPFAEAMAQARLDPELARWLERELAVDAAIRAKLKEATVPPGLEARILAGRHGTAPTAFWRRPVVAFSSLAAVLIVAIVLVTIARRPPSDELASYRQQMAASVAVDYKVDLESDQLSKLQEFFAERSWPSDYSVPASLQAYPLEGGMAVEWHGHKVSVLCFGAEGDDSKDMWLFVAGRDAVSDPSLSATPRFASASSLITATWTSGDKVYLLAGRGDERSLRKYL